jgi:hypothetical protein
VLAFWGVNEVNKTRFSAKSVVIRMFINNLAENIFGVPTTWWKTSGLPPTWWKTSGLPPTWRKTGICSPHSPPKKRALLPLLSGPKHRLAADPNME